MLWATAPTSPDECITALHPFLVTTNTTRAQVDSSGETIPDLTPTTSLVPWLAVPIDSTSFTTCVLIQTTLSQLWLVMLALLLLLFPLLLLLALALTRTLSFLGSRHSVPKRHHRRPHGCRNELFLSLSVFLFCSAPNFFSF